MAAVVTIATYVIRIPVPATSGYFNVGDAMVFASALLLGPFVGGVDGGLGSALADMWGGYWEFVPITLVVKGAEGLLAGFISNGHNTLRDLLAVLVGGAAMVFGYFISETYVLGLGQATALVEVPWNVLQITVGGLVGIPVSYAVSRYARDLR